MNGLQILKRKRAVNQETVSQFLGLPVANVSDSMSRMFAGGAKLRPMHNGAPMSGPALTVRTRPGDNLFIHKAIALASPGDVIVVDAGADLTNALIGEIMSHMASVKGLGGFVINGSIRDAKAIKVNSFPVFALGVTHRGPYKDGPGEINTKISLDGMVIEPGDLIIGDDDGCLCVPYDQCESVYKATKAKTLAEEKMIADITAGRYDGAWVDETLRRLGCYIEE